MTRIKIRTMIYPNSYYSSQNLCTVFLKTHFFIPK